MKNIFIKFLRLLDGKKVNKNKIAILEAVQLVDRTINPTTRSIKLFSIVSFLALALVILNYIP